MSRVLSAKQRKDFATKSSTMPHIVVIVPVYNSASTLPNLIERLKTTLSSIHSDYAIILVDDRGPQAVWPIIQKASKSDERVKGIRFSRNFGQHAAITAGIEYAKADWYVVMDCDLQDRPEDISLLYKEAIASDLDSVIAKRKSHGTKKRRKLGSVIFNFILRRWADIPTSEQIGNFRIFNDAMAQSYQQYGEKMRLFPAIMSHLGFEDGYLELERSDRQEGKSNYTFRKLFALAFDSIISNTIKPMYYLAGFGVFNSILAVIFATAIIAQKLFFDVTIEGWASLMTALMLIGGIQIFVVSLVGIYVGKVFFEVKDRPIFIVEQSSNLTLRVVI